MVLSTSLFTKKMLDNVTDKHYESDYFAATGRVISLQVNKVSKLSVIARSKAKTNMAVDIKTMWL